MKLHGIDGSELMEVATLSTRRDSLIIRGSMMGAMPIEAVLKPPELREALKLLNFRIIVFLVCMLLKR